MINRFDDDKLNKYLVAIIALAIHCFVRFQYNGTFVLPDVDLFVVRSVSKQVPGLSFVTLCGFKPKNFVFFAHLETYV